MKWYILVLPVLFTGCINITASLQPENTSVKEVLLASDCVPIILGFGFGNASLEGALAQEGTKGRSIWTLDVEPSQTQKLTKIRRVQLHDQQFLFFGERCVEVVGE